MELRNAFRPALTINEDLHDELQQAQDSQWAVVVTPPEDASNDPRETAEEVFRAIHGELDSLSFEIHQTRDGRIEFRTGVNSWDAAMVLKNRIMAELTGCDIDIAPATLDVAVGETIAGARLEYAHDHLLPLRTTKSHDVADDPYAQVFETISEEPDSRTVIQFVIKPVTYSWPFRWGYRLLQLWDERIETTWTSRWSRWPSPSLMTHRRRRKPSLTIASLFSLIMYAGWVGIGGNPITALPSIQVLDALIPATMGPVTVPADLSTSIFGPSHSIDLAGKVTYAIMMVVAVALYSVALFGEGLGRPRRKTGDTEADRARSKGKIDRQASKAERQTGEAIQHQGRDLGYRVNARIVTIDEEAARASAYRDSLVTQFSNSWRHTATKQRLTATTMGRFGHLHHRLPRFVRRVAGRTSSRTRWFWIQKLLFQGKRRKPIYMAPFEIASLAYWPVESKGGTAAIEYTEVSATQALVADDGAGDEVLEGTEPERLPDVDVRENGADGSAGESSSAASSGESTAEDAVETPPPQHND
jgi:hypothetical protein